MTRKDGYKRRVKLDHYPHLHHLRMRPLPRAQIPVTLQETAFR
jgi:hypothetical protein